MVTPADATSPLTRIWTDLRSKNEETRAKAASDLRDYVISNSRELSGESFTKFMNEINRKIYELVHSPDNDDKQGGILAIDNLIEIDGEDNTMKTTRFANFLRIVLPSSDSVTMEMAAKALGRLALYGGTLTADFVEFEVKRALEWLQGDRFEARRFAAVLVLRELAQNTPTLVYAFVPQILDLIWVALRDPKVTIREKAAETLRVCLDIIQQRESQLRVQWYRKILEEAQKGLKLTSPEAIHGSLLAYRELLQHTGRFMDSRYRDLCETVFRLKYHSDPLVRTTVIELTPILAEYDPSTFAQAYLNTCMNYLLLTVEQPMDKEDAFRAIGKVAMSVGTSINPYLDDILKHIRTGLAQRGSPKESAAIFDCISMLATAVGPALTKYMHDLLEEMFAVGLSESLRQALVDLAQHNEPLLPTIQERLLNMISLILDDQPYRPPGAPAPFVPYDDRSKIKPPAKRPDTDTLILALNTLGTFDFTGNMLSEFVRDCVVKYLDDPNADVRRAAAVTCCQLLVRDPICQQTSNHAMQVMGEVLDRLLTVGISDADASIRQTVLSSLDERFDRHLAQAEHIRSLFIALNDEVFSIRETAMGMIGRLTQHNPAYIMPSLRRTLIQLLSELEYSNVVRNKEEAARLLCSLIASSQKLIRPYVEPVLKVLLPKTKDPSAGVAAQVLAAFGELAQVGGPDLAAYLDQLLEVVIEALQDQSSPAKREVALRTLGQLASSTGHVMEPYLRYPDLLGNLLIILKSEQSQAIRKEAVKTVGILGALDPYKYNQMHQRSPDELSSAIPANQITDIPVGMSPSAEDYYPTVAVSALVKILKDPTLSSHHTAVVQAMMYMFKTMGLKCVPFLPQIIPPMLAMMRTCPINMLEFHFQQLAVLVSIVKQHIRVFLPDILQVVQEFWNASPNIQITILTLLEAMSLALDGDFKTYLPNLLPQVLLIMDTDNHPRRQPSLKVLQALNVFGTSLDEYLHLVLPAMIRCIERPDSPPGLRKTAIVVIGKLCKKLSIAEHASRVVQPLVRILATAPGTDLSQVSMDTFASLAQQMGQDFSIFIPTITKVMQQNGIVHARFTTIVTALQTGENVDSLVETEERLSELSLMDETPTAELGSKKLPVNQQNLKRAWEASQRSTREDWVEWIRRFSVELLKESPSHALRACASLASVYYPLARELFNAAFLSCWSELHEQYQDELVRSLKIALAAPNIPPEIVQTLLNLAEFMEHDDKALPIEISTLGSYAAKCHAYAKALHYKEMEFMSEPLPETIEALISINNQLQQHDSAIGILTYAQQNHDVELKESWYEKLQRWDDALVAYERKQAEDPMSVEATFGRMRCLHALGEWEALSLLAQEKWMYAREDVRRAIAPLAAAAAWGLGQWDLMDEYIAVMRPESPDGAFFRAILFLHRNSFVQASQFINRTRDMLDTELTALVGESYNRAYHVVVRIQMLAELEEIITYKQMTDEPDRQALIRTTWKNRLHGAQRNVDVWQRILKIRALAVTPKEDMDMWIKFANLCRKSGRLSLAQKTLLTLLSPSQAAIALSPELPVDFDISKNLHVAPAPVTYSYLKFMWASGDKVQAFQTMKMFSKVMVERLGINNMADLNFHGDLARGDPQKHQMIKVLARAYLKLGEWQSAMQEDGLTEEVIPDILRSYLLATHFDKDWYKAWHAWALANFEVLAFYDKQHENIPPRTIVAHVVPSVQGFFRSIALAKNNSLQDTLRLLTLWFKYGYQQDVNNAVGEGFNTVTIDTWLQVIPQLIARIHTPSAHVRRLIHQLLTDVGKEHPQALVYPLTVASKSQSAPRKKAALAIMEKMRSHSAVLVEQALLVSQELIRVAILWHEMWYEGLEEASRLYFGDHNVEGMFATLEPLHQMLERGPETLKEVSFNQAFGRDLAEALDWCKKYRRTLNVNDLNQAWDLYYLVFRRINKQLPQLTTLELQYVSPKLLEAKDLQLAVPGTYKSGEAIIRIAGFAPTLTVITSKQRPRKLSMKASDGNDYQYLLKGHEDLRQDERVMQLFGLVNTLLGSDPETFKRDLNIQRYPVIPLSPNSGLIGWVPNCDTMHALIRDYRESRKILLNIEHRLMLQMAPDYDNLTLLQKVEVFQYALENATGQDLYKVLWLKSRNAEAWLDRRTNYTRSLAVMSMVGYILGLGDRHPSNLMLDRFTGKIIHIDFGDCFEVAMHREKFPEKIPFRLTRMLINAMEVSGIEGNYRITCEHVMRVLRENKDSLMAVLEAFVYDPLINWRLMTNASPKQDVKGQPNPRRPSMDAQETSEIPDDPVSSARYPSARKLHRAESSLTEDTNKPEAVNTRALTVINRVNNKLTGRDFKPTQVLDVPAQVQRLILQATSLENLCQCYVGFCAFW